MPEFGIVSHAASKTDCHWTIGIACERSWGWRALEISISISQEGLLPTARGCNPVRYSWIQMGYIITFAVRGGLLQMKQGGIVNSLL